MYKTFPLDILSCLDDSLIIKKTVIRYDVSESAAAQCTQLLSFNYIFHCYN